MYNLQKITIIWQYIMFHAVFCLKVVFLGDNRSIRKFRSRSRRELSKRAFADENENRGIDIF